MFFFSLAARFTFFFFFNDIGTVPAGLSEENVEDLDLSDNLLTDWPDQRGGKKGDGLIDVCCICMPCFVVLLGGGGVALCYPPFGGAIRCRKGFYLVSPAGFFAF